MEQVLSLSARPVTMDGLIGQERTVRSIRNRHASGRMPKAWLFYGPLGTGKTSIARILALSLQCQHQEQFGRPCKECYAKQKRFLISELNASDLLMDKIRANLTDAWLNPMGDSVCRVYIMDEIQGLDKRAQRLLLKYLEDAPKTTYFILCTTEPHNLLETIRSRCAVYEMRSLTVDEIKAYVQKLLTKIKSSLPADRLVDTLVERGIAEPRFIANSVESYVALEGNAEEAAKVDAAQNVDTKALTRAVIKGDWAACAAYFAEAQPVDAKPIRLGLIRYLRGILFKSEDTTDRTAAVADAIEFIAALQNVEDSVVMAGLGARVFKLARLFQKYKH